MNEIRNIVDGSKTPYFPKIKMIEGVTEGGSYTQIKIECYTRHKDENEVWRRVHHVSEFLHESSPDTNSVTKIQKSISHFLIQVYNYILFAKVGEHINPVSGVEMFPVEKIQETEEERIKRLYHYRT